MRTVLNFEFISNLYKAAPIAQNGITMKYKTAAYGAILEYFSSIEDHGKREKGATTGDIISALEKKSVPRSTVYRQLTDMCRRGELIRYRGENGEYLFLRGEKKDSCLCRFHLKCTKCGKESHLDCHMSLDLSRHIKEDHGFVLGGGCTTLFGLCRACEGANDEKQ